jgi:hypothetical protein
MQLIRGNSAGVPSSSVPAHGQVVCLVEESSQLPGSPLRRVEDRDPSLGRVDRMREEYVARRVVELVVMGGMLCRRVAQKPLETAPTDGDVDAEYAVAVELRLRIPARVVMDHQGGERESLILGDIPFGIVEEECVHPKPQLARRSPRSR